MSLSWITFVAVLVALLCLLLLLFARHASGPPREMEEFTGCRRRRRREIYDIDCLQKDNLWTGCIAHAVATTAAADANAPAAAGAAGDAGAASLIPAVCRAIFPPTYMLPEDLGRFVRHASPQDVFILKRSAIGERKGLKLARKQEVVREATSGYDLVQQYLPNLWLIKNRVFHIRQYLVVDCDHGNYLYHNSLYLFAERPFTPARPVWKAWITASLSSGIQAGRTYDKLGIPRDEPEFRAYCATHGLDYARLRAGILEQYRHILRYTQPCRERHAGEPRPVPHLRRKIYGTDVVVLQDGSSRIIEINNYPSLLMFKNTQPPWQVRIKEDLVARVRRQDYAEPHFTQL